MWANIVQMLYKCFVLDGYAYSYSGETDLTVLLSDIKRTATTCILQLLCDVTDKSKRLNWHVEQSIQVNNLLDISNNRDHGKHENTTSHQRRIHVIIQHWYNVNPVKKKSQNRDHCVGYGSLNSIHWTHDVVATLNQRQWRWFNVVWPVGPGDHCVG